MLVSSDTIYNYTLTGVFLALHCHNVHGVGRGLDDDVHIIKLTLYIHTHVKSPPAPSHARIHAHILCTITYTRQVIHMLLNILRHTHSTHRNKKNNYTSDEMETITSNKVL